MNKDNIFTKNRVTRAVLGADDREMKLVRKAFELAGIPTVDAQAPGPQAPLLAYESAVTPEPGDVWVECRPLNTSSDQLRQLGAVVVDHHNPGDPESPSIFQVIDLLAKLSEDVKEALYDHGFLVVDYENEGTIQISEAVVVVGRADHNLAKFWESASSYQKHLYVEGLDRLVRPVFETAVQAIIDAPDYMGLADLRDDIRFYPYGKFCPSDGTRPVPVVNVASVAANRPYITWGVQGVTPLGRHVSVGGPTDGLDLKSILQSVGATGIVAPPGRGFALGYVPWD